MTSATMKGVIGGLLTITLAVLGYVGTVETARINADATKRGQDLDHKELIMEVVELRMKVNDNKLSIEDVIETFSAFCNTKATPCWLKLKAGQDFIILLTSEKYSKTFGTKRVSPAGNKGEDLYEDRDEDLIQESLETYKEHDWVAYNTIDPVTFNGEEIIFTERVFPVGIVGGVLAQVSKMGFCLSGNCFVLGYIVSPVVFDKTETQQSESK